MGSAYTERKAVIGEYDVMIADDLDQAYINFDPLLPLPGDSEFYVDRRNNPLGSIQRALMRPADRPPKFLFSGHRSSGKSTELNKLMSNEKIKGKYFIVKYSVREILDTAGLDYTDLLLSIGAQIFIKAIDEGLKIKEKLLKELNAWRSTIEIEKTTDESAAIETEAGLKAFFINAQGKLKLGYDSRQKIRQTIEPRLNELIGIINLIIDEVESKPAKKVIVVIDDLDKPDLLIARKLFYERQSSLTQVNCAIIYTVPIALFYSPEAGQVRQAFTNSYVLPNVSIIEHDSRTPYDEGRAIMKEFVEKRMLMNLIEEDALKRAITISGGVFREMARIISISADNAISRGSDKIQWADVQKAESEPRNEFRRMLETEDYVALKEIYQNRELRGSEICAKLLHNLSVLEYRNDENWCDIHPVIVPLIKEEES